MAAQYYIRARKEENPKKWQGPYESTQLKELADRRLFSKELHEYSEDRLNWISARQIWPTLFPKNTKSLLSQSQPLPVVTTSAPAQADGRTQSSAQIADDVLPAESLLAVDDSPEWYFSTNGAQQGPYTLTQLRKLAAEGRVANGDLVWCPRFGEEWIEVQAVPELSPTQDALFQFSGGDRRARDVSQAQTLALSSFVLGLLGASFLLGLGSIIAVVLGHMALAQFSQPQVSSHGRWMAITGLALGYAMIAILLIGTVIYLAVT